MLYRVISRILGKYLFYFSLILFIPLVVSLYFDFIEKSLHPKSSLAFLETIVISFALSFVFRFWGRKSRGNLHRRESIFLVVLIWLMSALVGSFPFIFSGTLTDPIDAYFETMSGFTTTGASVICPKKYDGAGREVLIHDTNVHIPHKTYSYYGTIAPIRDPNTRTIVYTGVEAVSKGVLFWRSFIQWLGGMGIVVLFLSILPNLAVGGRFLFQTEVPGPTKEALTPRIQETSSILWKLYLGMTVAEIFLLIWTNPKMPLFDVFCTTFSTLSTGGFTVRNASIAAYNNPYTDWIIIFFMIFGSVNFAYYFHLIKRKFQRVYEMDLFVFLGFIIIGAILVSLNLIGSPQVLSDGSEITYTTGQAVRYGVFQAVSAQTSTGFATANYDMWPFAPQLIMLLLMFVGGMSGSTAGGIKTSRFYILFKIVIDKIEEIFRPEKVRPLRVGQKELDNKIRSTVLVFFVIAVFFAVAATVALTLNGVDPETSISTVTCMLNNIGISFRATGPTGTFSILPPLSKIISIFLMLLGRLEFFAVLLLFIPSFWRHK